MKRTIELLLVVLAFCIIEMSRGVPIMATIEGERRTICFEIKPGSMRMTQDDYRGVTFIDKDDRKIRILNMPIIIIDTK